MTNSKSGDVCSGQSISTQYIPKRDTNKLQQNDRKFWQNIIENVGKCWKAVVKQKCHGGCNFVCE